MEDFPLEQSPDDTVRSAFEQMIQIDSQLVCCDTQTGQENTKLPVPNRHREIIYQMAHYNPMAVHMGCDKTLD